jgi:hypothetical protein
MSGDNAKPAVDDRTRALIASLIETGIESALAARHATFLEDSDGAAAQSPSAKPAANSGRAEIHPCAGGTAEVQGGDAPIDDDGLSEAGGAKEEEEAGEEDADEEDEAGGPQAFSAGWYEARRGRRIPPRFEIPRRFDPQYPVAFPAESVAHLQLFGSGNASEGRSGEAAALYSSAAYLTEIANDLDGIGRELECIEALIPATAADRLREARWALSNVHLSTFGTYELSASRYELLCGLQGASGVEDQNFLETFLDAVEVLLRPALEPGNSSCSAFYCFPRARAWRKQRPGAAHRTSTQTSARGGTTVKRATRTMYEGSGREETETFP